MSDDVQLALLKATEELEKNKDNAWLLVTVRNGKIFGVCSSGNRKHVETLIKTSEDCLRNMKEGRT